MSISVQINPVPMAMQDLTLSLASKRGPLDVYCWYEGPQGLSRTGATFYKKSLFDPLLSQRADVLINLYSLKGWNFENTISNLSDTPLGIAIERCNNAAIRCMYSSAFFQFCLSLPRSSGLSLWTRENLPQKQWLLNLSQGYKLKGKTVADLFDKRPTFLDCICNLDVSQAYSYLQYMEGYYLIREAVTRAINESRKCVQVAFVLPNDEYKYYKDLPQDLEPMLKADLADSFDPTLRVDVSFTFFAYGRNASARPYIDRDKDARNVTPEEIPFYLPLSRQEVDLKVEACS